MVPAKADRERTDTIEFTKDNKIVIRTKEPGNKEHEVKGTYKFLDPDEKTMEVELSFAGEAKKEKLEIQVTKTELTTLDSRKRTETFKRAK